MARKTFASTVLPYNDVPMEIVSELLGHSSEDNPRVLWEGGSEEG